MRSLLPIFASVHLLALGCNEAVSVDAGVDATIDDAQVDGLARRDSGAGGDAMAGLDAGTEDAAQRDAAEADAAAPDARVDAGDEVDAGVEDAGPPADCISSAGHIEARPGVCVGVPEGIALEDWRSDMADTRTYVIDVDGTVVENKRILGCVEVRARNVTLRGNYIECYRSRDINNNASPYVGNGPVTIHSSAEGAIVEHNTLVCRQRNPATAACDYGMLMRAGTARYNDLSGMVDGFDPGSNVTIEYNYVHDFGTAYEEWREVAFPGESSHYSHADGVQLYLSGAGNVTIRGNYFQGLREAPTRDEDRGLQAVLIQASSPFEPKPDVQILNNVVAGHWASLRLSCVGGAACLLEENIIDAIYRNSAWAVDLRGTHPSTRARCNRFSDGSLVQSSNTQAGNSITDGC